MYGDRKQTSLLPGEKAWQRRGGKKELGRGIKNYGGGVVVGNNRYVHYLDCGGGFTNISIR